MLTSTYTSCSMILNTALQYVEKSDEVRKLETTWNETQKYIWDWRPSTRQDFPIMDGNVEDATCTGLHHYLSYFTKRDKHTLPGAEPRIKCITILDMIEANLEEGVVFSQFSASWKLNNAIKKQSFLEN